MRLAAALGGVALVLTMLSAGALWFYNKGIEADDENYREVRERIDSIPAPAGPDDILDRLRGHAGR